MKKEERHLEITTIAGCKISCAYCPQAMFALEHKKVSDDRMMSLQVFKKSLETVPLDIDIHFSGYSEPFLNPDCIHMIRHAFEKGYRVSVYTTVDGMTSAHVEALEQMTFKNFMVHLPDNGQYMRVKVDINYLGVLERLINSTIPDLTYIDYFGVHPKILALLKNDELASRKLTSRAGNVSNELTGETPFIKGPIRCRVNRLKKNVLLPNGDVSLCCVDYGKKHVLGNLVQDHYSDLHRGNNFLEIKKRMRSKKGDLLCRTCEWAEPITWKYRIKSLLKT